MNSLTKQQESFCENTGLFGVMISLTCLVQHLFFMEVHWVTFVMTAVYILCIAGFVLLMKKSVAAFRILIISVILVFLLESFMLLTLAFSLVLLLLLFYVLTIVMLLYTGEIPGRLKHKLFAEQEEAAKWNGII